MVFSCNYTLVCVPVEFCSLMLKANGYIVRVSFTKATTSNSNFFLYNITEAQAYNDEEGLDAIDAFMESLKTGTTLDTRTKMKIKRELFELKQQRQKLAKLINIAKPSLPKLMQLV